jgi:hypothetical protein
MSEKTDHKSIKSRINRVKNLILKSISDYIEKKQKRIPSKEEVIAIYEKRRAEHEKKVTELEKKQKAVAPAPALAPAPLKKGLTPKKANIV